ncbi:hypothetical protein V5799_011244 [Amblyomma americanum]|uniref:Uncharacterized protein n=1 Tax=Amblyomma americanum TaxID=6943 RepID=A0AAQ4EHN3_AMBAM
MRAMDYEKGMICMQFVAQNLVKRRCYISVQAGNCGVFNVTDYTERLQLQGLQGPRVEVSFPHPVCRHYSRRKVAHFPATWHISFPGPTHRRSTRHLSGGRRC